MAYDSTTTTVLINLAESLIPVQNLITGAAYVIGVAFAFKAIYSLKVYGEARTMMATNSSMKEPAFYIMIAAILIYFPTGFEIFMNTTFGYSNVLSYGDSELVSSTLGDSDLGNALVIIFQTVGLYAFVRGWVLIARASSQGQPPGGTGKGLMHVFGGILAVNIVGTVEMINNTLFGT